MKLKEKVEDSSFKMIRNLEEERKIFLPKILLPVLLLNFAQNDDRKKMKE